jgi:hypothetical protein
VITILLAAVVGVLVVNAAFRRNRLPENLAIIRQYRPIHIASSVAVGGVIVVVSWGLYTASPVFRLNPLLWLVARIFHVGTGAGQQNWMLSGLQWRWYALVFLPVLALALPRFARREEVLYRARTRNWVDGAWRSLRFGLVMFIPLCASLSLTIAGLWLTWLYFRGGVERSTIYHAAFNTTLIAALFILVAGGWAS